MSLHQAFSSRNLARKFHNEWISDVKRHVPPEKLLVYHVKFGWGPLCDFLGLKIPPETIPFPRSHDTKEIQSGILKMQIISWTILILAFIVLCIVMIIVKSFFL